MKKAYSRFLTAFFCLFLGGLLAVHVFLPDRESSETENRTLAQLPEFTIQHHVLYLDRDFIRLSSNWAELQKGSDEFIVGKLFTFKTLEELFHKSGDSYVRAVQDYCRAVMLNTLDKDGQPLKHHIPPKGRINL